MKKIVAVLALSLFTFCSVERDNPLDKEGDKYVDPSLSIIDKSITDGGINNGKDLYIELSGNTNFNLFQFILDEENWSNYTENTQIYLNDLSVGPHTIIVQTKYPDNDQVYSEDIKFFVVDSSSIFLSPIWVTTEEGQIVELHCQNIPDDVVTMHVKFNNVLIDSASLSYTNSENVKLLYSDSLIDIASLPGGESLGGTKSIASLKLKGFTGATVYLDVDMRDKSDNLIECDSTFGLLIK